MIKVKNQKRFKIFIIVCVIVCIVLIWSLLIHIMSKPVKQENLSVDKTVTSSEQILDNIEKKPEKSEDSTKEKIENQKADTNVKQEQQTKPVETTGNNENEANATKPLIVPQNLPADQVYSIFNNTLIIGDSRTEGFKLYSGVKNASYFCMKAMTIDKIVQGKQVTIDGHTVSVYNLLDAATYDKVIVGVGLNELGWNHIETFLNDYGQLIDKIKEKQPNATIYLQAVLPVSKSKNDTDKVHNNAQVYWYNENIIKLASDKGVQYVNPAAALVDADGYLVAEATTDGVHLNSEYCKIWAKYLAELISK